jgi:SNF2 family DNA or RNA helicase
VSEVKDKDMDMDIIDDDDGSSSIESFSRPSSPYYAYRNRRAGSSSATAAIATSVAASDDDDDDIITDDMEETEAPTKRAATPSTKLKNSLPVSEVNQAASDRLTSLVRYRKIFEPFIPPKVMQLLNELLLLKNNNNNNNNNNSSRGDHQQQQQSDFDDDIILSQPPSLSADCVMKGYQMEGLSWLVRNYNRAINCILADEMGLGKTLQSISLVAHLAITKQQSGPYLFVVPLSVLFNWMAEFKKWCPTLKVLRLHSNDKEEQSRLKTMLRDPDIAQVT